MEIVVEKGSNASLDELAKFLAEKFLDEMENTPHAD